MRLCRPPPGLDRAGLSADLLEFLTDHGTQSLDRLKVAQALTDLIEIIRAYEVLYATDLAIKTGRFEEKLAMTLCVLDLCGVHAADPRELVVGEPPRR